LAKIISKESTKYINDLAQAKNGARGRPGLVCSGTNQWQCYTIAPTTDLLGVVWPPPGTSVDLINSQFLIELIP